MEKEKEHLFTEEDLKKSFDLGFESAVSLIEESLGLQKDGQFPYDGQKYLIECIENKTLHSRFIRRILFNQIFKVRLLCM